MKNRINSVKCQCLCNPFPLRVQVASADIILQHGDVEKALKVLSRVTPEQAHYADARRKMADIYLKQRKDRKLYIACYK